MFMFTIYHPWNVPFLLDCHARSQIVRCFAQDWWNVIVWDNPQMLHPLPCGFNYQTAEQLNYGPWKKVGGQLEIEKGGCCNFVFFHRSLIIYDGKIGKTGQSDLKWSKFANLGFLSLKLEHSDPFHLFSHNIFYPTGPVKELIIVWLSVLLSNLLPTTPALRRWWSSTAKSIQSYDAVFTLFIIISSTYLYLEIKESYLAKTSPLQGTQWCFW